MDLDAQPVRFTGHFRPRRFCLPFLGGHCSRGSTCTFVHARHELHPDVQRQAWCLVQQRDLGCATLTLGHHTKAELIDSVLKVVEEESADKSDMTVKVLTALLFDFTDFILDTPTQLGMHSPFDRAWF